MGELLSVHKLGFGYRKKQVLHDISFSIRKGAICGLLGPNASGKTTLLKCINGVLPAHQGETRVHGKNISGMSRQEIARLMAVVPQQMTLAFAFTALQMVIMGRAARMGRLSLPSGKDRADAQAALDELGIGELAHRPFNELSGGERQLVLLARAIFQDTPILLLDEPTSHLDFRNQFMIMDVVREMTKTKRLATIVSLHDPNLAARYCSQLVVLKQGRLHRHGASETVFDSETISDLYGMEVVVERQQSGHAVAYPATGAVAS
jgi:iron complex transport system ATP-binding protein